MEDELEFAAETFSLYYDEEELEDERSLRSYNFEKGERYNVEFTRDNEHEFYITVQPGRRESNYERRRIEVGPSYLVASLRNKVERIWGVPGYAIDLSHKNVLMRDDFTLAHYDICKNSVVKVDVKE
ncbi:hypothetical protein JCGZ_22490 [Jatropha curcas]|uniref:Ubiquitin-like domain-containing protein n=2 Tax=Jatropha curcas TaxID=180498 RepID=A0A067K394_JATCU|nr:hypothetical protein JCGZ_22490 [Jatropha curcas]